jgi:hypothetical protein
VRSVQCLRLSLNIPHVLATTNLYLGDVDDFAKMNRVDSQYFTGASPTRTAVEQTPTRGGGRRPAANSN